MTFQGQRIDENRYTVIPRTLSFLLHENEVLLIRLHEDRPDWSGLLNGVGGHIEQGEDPLGAARREIYEETGLIPSKLKLCGVVIIDSGDRTGIALYVFVGETDGGQPIAGPEGTPIWLSLQALDQHRLVEDIPILLPHALSSYRNDQPFSALYSYNEAGDLMTTFTP
jgi:8-oxo-dGTP pyrophosphatase MutT (NUDIX family)